MRPAGVTRRVSDETCAKSLQPDIFFPPTVGVSRIPNSKINVPDIVHGKSTAKSESVAKCFRAMRTEGVDALIRHREESIYKSNENEPLGKSRVRHFDIPSEQHAYGKPKDTGPRGKVFEIFSPAYDMIVPPKKRLTFVWPPQVNSKFMFGFKEKKSEDSSIHDALQWKTAKSPKSGDSSRSSSNRLPVSSDFAFGVPSHQGKDSAAACIRSNFVNVNDLLPDENIGRTVCRIKA
jgi:hypothetical protein